MQTTNKPLKISISTQKGGVGKSTITTLLASLLHYRLGYNVLVMDCDFPQHSLAQMRERDKTAVMQSEYHRKAAMRQFQSINKKAYPILKSKAESALQESEDYLNQSSVKPDIIFYDLPGTANTKGVLSTLKSMDYIFSPMTADRLVVESTLNFTKAFLSLPGNPKVDTQQQIWLFWNQVDGREKTMLYEKYEEISNSLDLPVMRSRIMDSKRFRKESQDGGNQIFRSTLLPPESKLMKATRIDQFLQEFMQIIKR